MPDLDAPGSAGGEHAPLFELEPCGVAAATDHATLSADRRRTQRQLDILGRGLHPLTAALRAYIPLHKQAAPSEDRTAPGRRCGTCWYRHVFTHPENGKPYPKCLADDGVRVTHGAGTDVRRWWPACTDHSFGDPTLSDDAARYVPPEADR
jgi:hypothetical protein